MLSGERVIVSTGTKALQDQLFFRDLPKVRSVLGARLKTALLKGRANYLCLYRLDQTVREGASFDRSQAAQLAAIRAWSARTRRGDRMELAEVPEDSPLWLRVTSTPENCLGVECPFYDDCHVVKARREAQEADLVVVNHHLLFADLALKQEGFGEILAGRAGIHSGRSTSDSRTGRSILFAKHQCAAAHRVGAGCTGRVQRRHRVRSA